MDKVLPGLHSDRLRHLKEALDISEHQTGQWMALSGALHAAMSTLAHSRAEKRGPAHTSYPSLPCAIETELRSNLVRLEACQALQEHVTNFYDVLSEKQRVLADRLLVPVLVAVIESQRDPVPLAA